MCRITIAGISLSSGMGNGQKTPQSDRPIPQLTEAYRKFRSSDSGDIIDFTVTDLDGPPQNRYGHSFDSSGLWRFHYNDRNDFRIEFIKGAEGVTLAFVDVDLEKRKGKIYLTEEGAEDLRDRMLPFVYPLDQVIFENLLPSFSGILIHACGIDDKGRGFLFPGTSGAGKSTTARLWADEAGVKVLSDDRIIIREVNDALYAYGTPWHGEMDFCDPGKVEIESIFVLAQSDKNYARVLSAADAAARMLVRCFPTFWDKEGMEFTLSFIEKIAKSIPCYELGFVPDKSAVSFVRSL